MCMVSAMETVTIQLIVILQYIINYFSNLYLFLLHISLPNYSFALIEKHGETIKEL